MSVFFRRRVETTIEHMIRMLDELDGDPDLEPEPVEEQGDEEPSASIPAAHVIALSKDRRLR